MNKEKIFYCKARNFPVYYKVDPKEGFIESIKNWKTYPKAIHRFAYSAVFARELKTYRKIDVAEYQELRELVAAVLGKAYPKEKSPTSGPESTNRNVSDP